jgi:uncharacterized protein YhfF
LAGPATVPRGEDLLWAARFVGMPYEDLPVAEFAFPGPLRDQLVAAILAGVKTTTTGLAVGYEKDGEPLPRPGRREAVVDSAGNRVTVIETIAVRVVRLRDVGLAHALGGADGYTSVTEGGQRMNGSGIRRRCEKRRAIRSPRSLTTPASWRWRSGWWRAADGNPGIDRGPFPALATRFRRVCAAAGVP